MPQLLLVGLAVAGGWYAWKAIKREMERIDREVEAVRNAPSETLERDPETGRYRLREAQAPTAPIEPRREDPA
jgi:hypothetical protein